VLITFTTCLSNELVLPPARWWLFITGGFLLLGFLSQLAFYYCEIGFGQK
jgi:hypothetical protein